MELDVIALAALAYHWEAWARPKQIAPPTSWRSWGLVTGRGFGKHLAVDTPIPVPLSSSAPQKAPGWTTMGALRVGDTVYDEQGTPALVTGAFDVETPDVCYRLHFSDGTHIDASSTHQWVTWAHAARKAYLRSLNTDRTRMPSNWPTWRATTHPHNGPKVRTTQEIVDTLTHGARGDTNHAIPVCGPIVGELARADLPCLSIEEAIRSTLRAAGEMPSDVLRDAVVERLGGSSGASGFLGCVQRMIEQGVIASRGKRGHRTFMLVATHERREIDPYVFGAWLGDGSSAAAAITIGDEDITDMRALLGAAGAEVGESRTTTYPVGRGWIQTELRRLGVLGHKHVPPWMLRAPEGYRLALLQGLMDTDGTASKGGGAAHVEFCSTSRPLAEAVVELARSLGQKPIMREGRARLYGRDVSAKFRVTWRPTIQVFRLPRKAAAVRVLGAQGFRNLHRMISRVERIAAVPMRCIAVDSPHRMYLAGEGMIPTHNTRAAAEFVVGEVMAGRARDVLFAAQNMDETERTMMAGPSGLVACSPPWFPAEIVKGQVVWPNGAVATPMTPEVPNAPRGGNRDLAWLSEVAAWPAATRDEFFSNVRMSVRAGLGRMVFDTTPKRRNPIVRYLLDRAARDPNRHIAIRGSSRENADNLTEGTIAEWESEYGGTLKGREELLGEFLDDADGALWKQEWIDRARRMMPTALKRRIIAVDPAISNRKGTDRTGLVELGLGIDDQVFVIDDMTDRYAWEVWGALVIDRYVKGACDCIIVERNRGGDAVVANLRACAQQRGIRVEVVEPEAPTRHVPGVVYVKETNARRGKDLRAEPVASLYERGRVSHVHGANLAELEEVMCTWAPEAGGASPDALDALVHGIVELANLSREPRGDGKAAIHGAAAMQSALAAGTKPRTQNVAAMLGGGRGGGRI
jgi:phage terminase large subunit-like protein